MKNMATVVQHVHHIVLIFLIHINLRYALYNVSRVVSVKKVYIVQKMVNVLNLMNVAMVKMNFIRNVVLNVQKLAILVLKSVTNNVFQDVSASLILFVKIIAQIVFVLNVVNVKLIFSK
jgi:hypothetical protein